MHISSILNIEKNNKTIIISVKDHVIYNNFFIEELVNLHKKNNNSSIGVSGIIIGQAPLIGCTINYKNTPWNIELNNKNVDILNESTGILLLRSFFPKKANKNIFNIKKELNSNFILSKFLQKNNISRKVFNSKYKNKIINGLYNKKKKINFYDIYNSYLIFDKNKNIKCPIFYRNISFFISMISLTIIYLYYLIK